MAPPTRFNIEAADAIAAKNVRSALAKYVNPPNTVPELVRALYVDGKIDELTYSYVLRNEERFILCPPPTLFEARWLAEKSHPILPSEKSEGLSNKYQKLHRVHREKR